MEQAKATLVIIGAIALFIFAFRNARGGLKKRRPGSAAVGSVYDLLNKDKRNAIEIIVEGRAAAGDPEHKDGNPPDPSSWKTHKPN